MLLTLLLAACYDYEQDVTTEEKPVDILSRFNAEGKAYLTIQIPIGATTRAATFDDGSADEFKVKDIYVLMFAGSTESDATFASAYKVETPTMSKSPFAQITTTATILLDNANLNSGNKLFPFVVVNNNASAISAFSMESVTFANNGAAVTLTGGSSTFSALTNVSIANYVDEDGYFLMSNATLADDNDVSQARVFRLPELDPDYFFPTEDLAKEHPAGQINVERLAAKATVEDGLDAASYKILGNEYATFESSDLMFALDNYNTNSYAYRHLSSVDYVRMVESTAITPFSPQSYRTYWGEDMNYSGNTGLLFKNHANRNSISWISLNNTTPMYCAENTFDVSHMQGDCTTSVLVRLQLNNGGDFYTTSVTGSDVIFQPPTNNLTEEGTSASESFVRRRSNVVTYDGTDIATIDDYLRTWLMEQSAALRTWIRDYAGNEQKHLKIEVTGNAETGLATATLSQTAQTSGTGFNKFESLTDAYTETDGATLKAYLQALLNSLTIKFYDDGYCYYRVLIRHFDDTQTPWSSAASMTDNTPAVVYGGDAENYLGRYGMVRNNWYNISINSVTHVGSPVIPPLTTNADDKVEQLLNATLHISGWEKHEQNLYE